MCLLNTDVNSTIMSRTKRNGHIIKACHLALNITLNLNEKNE